MQLTIDDIIEPKIISNPIWKDIEEAIANIDGKINSFVIFNHHNSKDYIQCAGNSKGLTVEYRQYLGNTFRHFRLGKGTGRSPLLNESFLLECKVGPITILMEELLTIEGVKVIFNKYFLTQELPSEYTKKNITKLFT